MSQTTWSQKPLPAEASTSTEHSPLPPTATSGSGSESTFSSSPRHFTIPINANSKSYTLEEVFQVWHDNKSQILNSDLREPKSSERYRVSVPSPIYHLDLQSTPGNVDDISQGIRDVAIDNTTTSHINRNTETLPISHETVPLAEPENIEWVYVDPSGNEQGPFNGILMQDWLNEGYLSPDLNLRRREESSFQTLKELCAKVQNFTEPFKVPLPVLSFNQSEIGVNRENGFPPISMDHDNSSAPQYPQFLSSSSATTLGSATRINTTIGKQPNLFGGDFIQQDHFPSALGPQSNVFSTPHNSQFIDAINPNLNFNGMNSINGTDTLLSTQIPNRPSVLSRTSSSWSIEPTSMPPPLATQINQPTPTSPWISGVQTQSRVSSPFVSTSGVNNSTSNENSPYPAGDAIDDHVLEGFQSSVLTGILNENEDNTDPSYDKLFGEQHHAEPFEHATNEEMGVNEQVKSQSNAQPRTNTEIMPETKKGDTKKVMESQPEDPVTSKRPQLAPWATPVKEARPVKSLKEIQKLEAEDLERQKRVSLEKKKESYSKQRQDLSSEKAAEIASFVGTGLPKSSSWASTSQNVTSPKSLAEIQKEESEAKLKLSKSNGSNTSKPSIASTLLNAVPKEDKEWTTVSWKKPIPKNTTTHIMNTSSGASKANPNVLRSVSAAQHSPQSINPTLLKEDFLVWARSSMTNLYPTVSKDDLLDIFVSLPSSSSDSSQLIGETIYSSSATMDGRRFAEEFLKRKQRVETQAGANIGDWGSAILSSANKSQTVDEDGWSTNTKSKKKSKKI